MDEYQTLKDLNLLQDWTVIVHGVPFDRAIFDEMASAGADLVWSPTSQLSLYGQDARADQALAAGFNVSLGTDWGVSGPKNLLASLKIAWELNGARRAAKGSFAPRYEAFSAYDLVRMVTANPAKSLGWENIVGQIKEGMVADILVIGDSDAAPQNLVGDPYRALISATEPNVQLVLVGGEALYGDQTIIGALKPGDFELIGDGSFIKAIDVTKIGVTKGDQTVAELELTLASAMNFNFVEMYNTAPIVPIISALVGLPPGQKIEIGTFAFLFGVVFHDYLPQGTPFPPGPADLAFFFTPGAMSLPLTPLYTSIDQDFFDFLETQGNAVFPDIQALYYDP